MKFKILFVLSLLGTSGISYANEIAITLDDLPSQQNEAADKQREINQKILAGLAKFNAPAIGFVNEIKLYGHNQTNEKTATLKLWVDKGYTLGNHTYSHMPLSRTDLQAFQSDVIKGANVSKKLMSNAGKDYKYFRHPYLDTGATKEMRAAFEAFLKKEGYIIAPVTIDTDDWKFNKIFRQNPKEKNKIIKEYLDHTRKKFAFYQAASNKIFGRNIKHIWLLHVNPINAEAIENILKIAKEFDYDFITLDEALQDKAYTEKDSYYNRFGVPWLYRWDFTRGKVVDWSKDPKVKNFLRNKNS